MDAGGASCSFCNTTSDKPRLPKGWKRGRDSVWCPECLKKHFIRRSIAIPVARPVDLSWEALRELMSSAWRESTALANWAVLQLAKNDIVRTPDVERMPKMPVLNLYRAWNSEPYDRRDWWKGASQSANCILRQVELRYRKARFATIWRRERALPTYRYPYPYPLDADAWTVHFDEEHRPMLSVALPGGRAMLQLRRDGGFWRQIRALERLADGAMQGECALYRVRIGGNSGQVVSKGHVRYRLMVKMTLWLPRFNEYGEVPEEDRRARYMKLSTGSDVFWRAEIPGRHEPWVLNMDTIRRTIRTHERYRQRMNDDLKHEKRWPKRSRKRMVDALALRCEKQNNRLRTSQQQAIAMLVGLARRAKITHVEYDDSNHDYVASFPWFETREMLRTKLDEFGIQLTAPPEPVEEEEVVEALEGADT